MEESLDIIFCKLLRTGLGLSQDFSYKLDELEWRSLLKMAKQQAMQGIIYNSILRLPMDSRPPRVLTMRLAMTVETIRGQNLLMNQESARYTQLFAERGIRSVILKGPANARLYPDPLSRQAGDIDVWIPGSYAEVEQLLLNMGLISKRESTKDIFHHIAFRSEKGVEIEVHHRLASGISFRNKSFSELLLTEIEETTFTPEGFYVPSNRFALLMQFSHLQHHLFAEGVGLRQFTDYFMLLTHSTKADREYVWRHIQKFHLNRSCAAIMWVLEKVFGLSHEYMLCSPNRRYGMFLYRMIMTGGNFGRYAPKKKIKRFVFVRWLSDRMNAIRRIPYDPLNVVLGEFMYYKKTLSLIPERIRRRKIALK